MLKPRKLPEHEKASLSEYHKALLSDELQEKMIKMAMVLTKGNKADSKDLIQQTYLKAIEKQYQFKGDNIDKWVIKILHNLFIDTTRKGTFSVEETSRDFDNKKIVKTKKIKRVNTYGNDLPDSTLIDDSEALVIERDKDKCLEKLSINEKKVISLKQSDSNEEIAEILDTSPGNIRQIIFRAREKFMRCMGFLNE